MKENDVRIVLLGNDAKDKILAIDVDGAYYKREENETLEDFLGRATWEHMNKTGINIFPCFADKTYDNLYSMRHSSYLTGAVSKNPNVVSTRKDELAEARKKAKRKTIAKRVAAVAISLGLLGSTIGCAKTLTNDNKNDESKAKATTEQTVDTKDLENKNVNQLIGMLDEKSGQKEALTKIVETQNYFNNVAAPSVKRPEDGDNQLFLTADETTASYIYANISTLGPTKMGKFFGKSEIMWINKEKTGEEPIYEMADGDLIANEFTDAMIITNYYYIRATEKSGLSNLFESKEEKEFFEDFENLVLEYNRTHSKEAAEKIRERLMEIFLSGDVDNLYEKFPGAATFIAHGIVPILQAEHVIDEDMLNDITDVKETLKCNGLDLMIDKMFEQMNCKYEGLNEDIVALIIKKQNQKLIELGRNVDMRDSVGGHSLSELYGEGGYAIGGGGYQEFNGSSKSWSVVKHWKKTYHSNERDKVVKKFGEKKVKEEEKKARDKAKIDEKNKKEEQRARDIQNGNNDAIDDFINNGGQQGKPDKDKSQDYKDQYEKTNKDLEEVQKQREEYDRTHPVERPVETESTTSNKNQNSSSESKSNSSSGSNSDSSSSSTPAPQVEQKSAPQKVKAVESGGEKHEVEEKQEDKERTL